MALRFVQLPLYSDQDYTYSVALEGQSYRIRITYNSVMQLYTMQVSDSDGNPIISGLGLVPEYPIGADYIIGSTTGNFILLPKANKDVESYKTYPDQIHKYYELSYLYEISDQ